MNPILYVIRPGDTLFNLANRFGVTVQDIINSNLALDPYNLRVGQQIYIYPKLPSNFWWSVRQVDLLKRMNLAWEQYIMWTRMFLISIADNLKDLNATEKRLLQNPKDIADIFRRYYGNSFANRIENLLTEHLKIGKDLIVALKNNNQNLVKELSDKWYKNADDMSEAFSSVNPFYSKEKIRDMLYDHLELRTDEVTARLRKDYSADIVAFDKVQQEVLKMSQYFVEGIFKQFSNLF